MPLTRGYARPDGDVPVGTAPLADHRERVVRLVAAERCGVGVGDLSTDLRDDRLEHLGWGRALCDKGRHPSQRRLFLDEPLQCVARVGGLENARLDVIARRAHGHSLIAVARCGRGSANWIQGCERVETPRGGYFCL